MPHPFVTMVCFRNKRVGDNYCRHLNEAAKISFNRSHRKAESAFFDHSVLETCSGFQSGRKPSLSLQAAPRGYNSLRCERPSLVFVPGENACYCSLRVSLRLTILVRRNPMDGREQFHSVRGLVAFNQPRHFFKPFQSIDFRFQELFRLADRLREQFQRNIAGLRSQYPRTKCPSIRWRTKCRFPRTARLSAS